MPKIEDYEMFQEEIEAILSIAKQPGRPALVPLIYITRSKDKLANPLLSGRPNIDHHFAEMMSSHPSKAGLAFACGPGPLVAELWDSTIQASRQGRRIDFHHEVFNF